MASGTAASAPNAAPAAKRDGSLPATSMGGLASSSVSAPSVIRALLAWEAPAAERTLTRPMPRWWRVSFERRKVVASAVTRSRKAYEAERSVDTRVSWRACISCIIAFVFDSASLRCEMSRVTQTYPESPAAISTVSTHRYEPSLRRMR